MYKIFIVYTAQKLTFFIDESDKEEEDALITNSPDLTAKEIRALVAICCALCQAPEYPDGVTSQDIKQKLYHDKQESIPAHCLDTGARLINAVRRITPKKDQNFLMASWCQMRTLRNILVVFAGRRTKRNPVKLTIVKQKDNDDQHAVRIDSGALYHLFSSDYDLYQSNGADKFTSVSVVKTEEQKLNLFNNFFRVNHVKSELAKQKIAFAGYFMFVNQYDLHFSGYRITQQIKQAKPIKKVPCLVDE